MSASANKLSHFLLKASYVITSCIFTTFTIHWYEWVIGVGYRKDYMLVLHLKIVDSIENDWQRIFRTILLVPFYFTNELVSETKK